MAARATSGIRARPVTEVVASPAARKLSDVPWFCAGGGSVTERLRIAELAQRSRCLLPSPDAIHKIPHRRLRSAPSDEHRGMDAIPATVVAARVAEIGGVVRSTRLGDEGHSRHRVAQAVDLGLLQRVRRGWLSVPDADRALVAAARHGVILSCVTVAHRRGLWVAERPAVPHAAYPGRGRIVASAAVVHWQRPIVPRNPEALEDGIENVLMNVASCLPYEQARAIWDSALNKRLVDSAALRRLPWTGAARRLADEATPWADSGLETFFVVRLRWLGLPIRVQIWIVGHRVDVLIGERLVVQIDGGHLSLIHI